MQKLKKILFLVALTVCMVLSLTACGKKKNTNKMDKDTVYREEKINLDLPQNGSISSMTLVGDKLYFLGYEYDMETYESKNFFLVSNLDGTGVVRKDITIEPNTYLDRAIITENGVIYCFFSSWEEIMTDDGFEYKNGFEIKAYDKDFNEKNTIMLSDKFENMWVSDVVELDNDNLLLVSYERFVVLDSNLKVVNQRELTDSNYSTFVKTKNGKVIATCWGTSGLEYYFFDINTLEKGEAVSLPSINYNYSMLSSKTYDLMFEDSQQIYGFNFGDTELKPIMNYLNSDLSTTGFELLLETGDGSFIGMYSEWLFDDYRRVLGKFTKVDPKDVVDKELISMGCLYMDYNVRKQVLEFNRNSDKYRIIVKDYSTYNTNDNWEAGVEKMNSDIASGQAPDIVVSQGTSSISNYISKGLFLDLNPYLDKDKEFDKSDLFPNLLEACSYNGKLYCIVPSFEVQTMVAKTSALKGKTSWTMKEMLEFEKSLPEGTSLFYGVDRNNFLYNVLNMGGKAYVDMAKGKCYFDSQDFIDLLEYVKTLPVTEDGDIGILYEKYDEDYYTNYQSRFRNNLAVAETTALSSFYSYKYVQNGEFGEDITFIGYPSSEGNGAAITFEMAFAISAKCANPDGAWQFVRHFLTSEYLGEIQWGIPASMSAFDALGKKALERDFYEYEGEIYYNDDYYYVNGESILVELLTEADIQKAKDHILATNKMAGSIDDLLVIIEEEAQAFFEGQKSAADVAKIIQSRASIYINEKQ